jgi:hypothetical protein
MAGRRVSTAPMRRVRSGVARSLRVGGPDCGEQTGVAAQRVLGFTVQQSQENTVAGRGARVFRANGDSLAMWRRTVGWTVSTTDS